MSFHEWKTFNNFQVIVKTMKKAVKKNESLTNWKIKIEIMMSIKEKWIWMLIDSTSDINYMNSHLWKKLKIKEKKWKQLLIIKNAKWNEIVWITKEIKEMKIQIV